MIKIDFDFLFCLCTFMSFRLAHIHDYHRFIAVDLGLDKIRVGLYNLKETGIVCTGSSRLRPSRKYWNDSIPADIAGIAQSIQQAILQAGVRDTSIPEDMIMNFPSKNFISDVITTQYLRENQDVPMTMTEIDQMIQKIEGVSHERAKRKSKKQFGMMSDDLKSVSSTIVQVQIDGRTVSSPIGFTGSKIRLTLLNIFVPSGEFNIIRSIVTQVDKKIISLIPAPLILPKLLEEVNRPGQNTVIIDVAYSQITLTVMCGDELIGFEIFGYGVQNFIDDAYLKFPNLSYLQIENALYTATHDVPGITKESIDDFLQYISDIFIAYLDTEHSHIVFDRILLYGVLFENHYIFSEMKGILQGIGKSDSHIQRIDEVLLLKKEDSDKCILLGLSKIASELLMIKKDPLVRILRYVLYQYE